MTAAAFLAETKGELEKRRQNVKEILYSMFVVFECIKL